MAIVIASPLTDLSVQFRSAFETLDLPVKFNKANAVFIKPNLTYPKYKTGVTTRLEFIETLVASLRKINETTKIYIGEGEGGYNSFSMTAALQAMGFFELEKKFPNVRIINISSIPSVRVELMATGKAYPIDLPEIFNEIDFSITCPLPKIHCMTGVTLSFKNQWGCLPDTMRLKNHYVFNEIIGQVCEKLKFRYAFLDGKFGLDRNGPMVGDPVEVNWFVASDSLGAFDRTVTGMMSIRWDTIDHLKNASKYGYIPEREEIKIIGDIEPLKRKFRLKRSFWNWPALAGFHSKHLTFLFYFSSLSKVLHDIMYTFRKRPISD